MAPSATHALSTRGQVSTAVYLYASRSSQPSGIRRSAAVSLQALTAVQRPWQVRTLPFRFEASGTENRKAPPRECPIRNLLKMSNLLNSLTESVGKISFGRIFVSSSSTASVSVIFESFLLMALAMACRESTNRSSWAR